MECTDRAWPVGEQRSIGDRVPLALRPCYGPLHDVAQSRVNQTNSAGTPLGARALECRMHDVSFSSCVRWASVERENRFVEACRALGFGEISTTIAVSPAIVLSRAATNLSSVLSSQRMIGFTRGVFWTMIGAETLLNKRFRRSSM